MNQTEFRTAGDLSEEERQEYTSVSIQILFYVTIGLLIALVFDQLRLTGYLPDGLVRAVTGSADTLGLTLAAIIVYFWEKIRKAYPLASRKLSSLGEPKAITWIIGGLLGLGFAFFVQAIIYGFTPDPYAPIGVTYAFAFSNLDNTIAGLTVLVAAILNEGRNGWSKYWRHPFFVGNAIMLVIIPTVAVIVRTYVGFRPSSNTLAAIESSLMDVDSIGAALIFLFATRVLNYKVPYLDDNIRDAFNKLFKRNN